MNGSLRDVGKLWWKRMCTVLPAILLIESTAALAESVLLRGDEIQAECSATEQPGLTIYFTKTAIDLNGRSIYQVEIISASDRFTEIFSGVVGYQKAARSDYSYTQYFDSSVTDPSNQNQVRDAKFQFSEFSSADSDSFTATLESDHFFYANQVDCRVLKK